MNGRLPYLFLLVAVGLWLAGCSQTVPNGGAAKESPAAGKQAPAQQKLVRMGGLIFDPTANHPQIPAELDNSGGFNNGPNLYVVQFIGYGTQVAAWREQLKEAGASLSDHYVPDDAILVLMDSGQAAKVGKMPFVRAVIPYFAAYKIDIGLKVATGELRPDVAQIPLLIEAWTPGEKQAIIDLIRQLNGQILDGATTPTNRLAATLTKEAVARLAQSSFVAKIGIAVPTVHSDSGGTKQVVDYG